MSAKHCYAGITRQIFSLRTLLLRHGGQRDVIIHCSSFLMCFLVGNKIFSDVAEET